MMKFDPRLPTTPGIRAPRYGESIMSVNGSPLQVPLAALGVGGDGECAVVCARGARGKDGYTRRVTVRGQTERICDRSDC